MPQPFVFRTIDLDGQTIRTAVRPGKEGSTPLLIFNGIGANLELVFPFVQALDPELEVIAFDVPGVGGSSTPSVPYRFPGLAKLAARMLDYLDYGQVNAIGVSWGGALAQQFAHDYPERCKKLILAATSAGAVMVPGKPKVLMRMASPRRYIQPSYGVHIAPDIYGGAFRRDPKLAMAHASKVRSSGKLGYYWQLFAGLGWTSIHWLHRIRQPTLVLAGDDDPIIPLINMRVLAWRIPNAELHVIDDGHLFLVTRAESVAPIIMKFLAEERRRAIMLVRSCPRPAELLHGQHQGSRHCFVMVQVHSQCSATAHGAWLRRDSASSATPLPALWYSACCPTVGRHPPCSGRCAVLPRVKRNSQAITEYSEPGDDRPWHPDCGPTTECGPCEKSRNRVACRCPPSS